MKASHRHYGRRAGAWRSSYRPRPPCLCCSHLAGRRRSKTMSMESLSEYCSQQPRPSTTPHYSLASSPSTTTKVHCQSSVAPCNLNYVGPELGGIFEGFELDDDAAAAAAAFAAAAALSTPSLFKNGLGKFSSAKSYSGEG
jgi:hypothetical protein